MFEKYSNIKRHENPVGRNTVIQADGQMDKTNLAVAFLNFAKEPRIVRVIYPFNDINWF